MKFGSLFSGIGGFDLGFEWAGMGCAWQVEIDKDCKRVLSRQFPSVQRFDDVTTVREFQSVDLICGGFPCQDLSVAGRRAGLAGERSGLWFEFLRIAEVNKPRWIVIENVPGLLSSDEGRDFAAILRGLVNVGYRLAWRVLDAQYFGVAQRRRRVFIVGSLGNGSCAQILFESESVSGNPPTRGEARKRIAATIKGGARGNGTKNGAEDAMNLVCGAVSSKWAKGTGGPAGDEAYNLVTHTLRSEGADASEDGTGRGTPIILADTLGASANRVTGKYGDVSPVPIAFQEAQTGVREYENAGSLRANAPGTQPTGTLLRTGFGVRRLTPRECERLQSFPGDWTRYDAEGKEISDSARYRMLGNAVAVNVAQWIGERILAAEQLTHKDGASPRPLADGKQ